MDFHLADTTATAADARAGRLPAGSVLLPGESAQGQPTEYVVRRRPIVSGEHLIDAQPSFQDGQPVVRFRFDTQGARRFGRATQENVGKPLAIVRSEEHTSELQSIMRISYAVFCLKKKNNQT